MIKKLKLKFILTNMILLTAVILASFVSVYFYTSNDLEKTSTEALHYISENGYDRLDHLLNTQDESTSKHPYLNTFTLYVNELKRTCFIDGFGNTNDLCEKDTAYINDLINEVNKREENEGKLKNYKLRYYSTPTAVGEKIVLLDTTYEETTLCHLITVFVIVGVVSLAAFLTISIIVAKLAVAPVEKSINQQKQLVADVSHELKTPITVISANADIISSHPESSVEEQSKWLGYIKEESKRMSDLVSDMLYLAKTDENLIKADLENINLSNAAYEAALPFESICFEKKKNFEIDIDSDLFAKANLQSVKQLTVILLDNAVKYSDENGIIRISLKPASDRVVLSVYNTGTPIPKDKIPDIFDRFYRVDKSRSRDMGGNGLGLSIAKRIIEMNEAKISVTSSEEAGTVFACSFKAEQKQKDGISFR